MRTGFFAWIFRNFQYKIAALILAFLFWYIVQGEEILEINRRIAVNIKVPDGYIIKGPEVRFKDATLRGSRVLLADFSTRPLEATIKVQDGKTGQVRYRHIISRDIPTALRGRESKRQTGQVCVIVSGQAIPGLRDPGTKRSRGDGF